MLALTLSVLMAQVSVPTPLDGISGGAGWVGASLLGGVLSWLLFIHLPNKDKQIAGLIETRDALVKQLAADFRAGVMESEARSAAMDKERRADFNNQLAMVVRHCETELTLTNQAIRRDLDELNGTLVDLRKMIAEIRDKNMQMWSAPEPRRRPGSNPPPATPGPGR
jgi:hypothetical protein